VVGVKRASDVLADVVATGDRSLLPGGEDTKSGHTRWNFEKRKPVPGTTYRLAAIEKEVLGYLAEGFMVTEIGDKMALSYDYIKRVVRRIYRELGAKTAAHAVHLAHRAGLLNPHEAE